MKKVISIILSLCMLMVAVPITAAADSTQILTGDYVVIINTNPDPNVTQSTGNIVFNSSGDGITQGSEPSALGASQTALLPEVTGSPSAATKTYSLNSTITVRNINYTCIAVGEACYIWMETSLKAAYDAAGKTTAAAQEMLGIYEGKPYSVLNTIANGSIPYLDGAAKLSILMESDPTTTAAGYYGMESDITAIHINCPQASSYMTGSLDGRNGLLAHEGQHAVFQLLAAQGFSTAGFRWIDEGLAITAMEWTWGRQPTSQWLSYIEGSSEIKKGASLVYENYRRNTALDYSLPALYVRYLADRYAGKYAPLQFMQELYKVKLYINNNADNQKTVEAYLNDVFAATGMKNSDGTALTFRQSLIDFYVAAVKQDASGIYSFPGDTTVYNSIGNYPVYMGASGSPVQLSGTAAIVVKTVNGTFTVPSSHGADIKYIAVNKADEPYRPATGEGTAANPFVLTSAEEFSCALDQYPNAHFVLANDIDLSGVVCSSVDNFSGVLDGKGFTVSGVTRAVVYKNSGVIRNLKIVGAANDEYLGTAALLAENNNGIVQDCEVSGSMSPRVIGAGIRYTPVWGTLVALNSTVGTVERCSSVADVTLVIDANPYHDSVAGNLVDKNSGVVRDCYSSGSLNVTRLGTSDGAYHVGGIAGLAKGGMSNPFYCCYSVTEITNSGSGGSTDVNIGRFAGSFVGNVYIENCYASDGMSAVGSGSGVASKTAAELKTQSTYTSWSFGAVWKMTAGSYPVFLAASDIVSVQATSPASIFVGQTLDYLSVMYIQLQINGSNLVNLTVDMVDLSALDSSTPGTKTVTCEYRSKSFPLTVQVNTPASVSELQVYEAGKTSYGEIDPNNHDGGTEIRNAVAPSCTAMGYSGDTYCLGCNTKLAGGTSSDKLNHTPEIRNAVAATCTAEGYTGDTYCAVCNTLISSGEAIAKLAHTPEIRNAVAATCTLEGYTGDTYCAVCNTLISSGEAIAKLAHSEGTPANFHAKAVCSVCSQSYGEIDPNNHVHTHIEGAYAATHDAEGYTGDTVCDDCGQTISQGSVIPKLECSCNCHKTGFMHFIYKIMCFFWKLFGIKQTCECGATHY